MENMSIKEQVEVVKAIAIEIKHEESINDIDVLDKTFKYLNKLGR